MLAVASDEAEWKLGVVTGCEIPCLRVSAITTTPWLKRTLDVVIGVCRDPAKLAAGWVMRPGRDWACAATWYLINCW